MTIICALQANDGTWIASDTMLTSADRKFNANHHKWITYRSWGLGFSGSWKAFNILQTNSYQLLSKSKYPQDIIKKLHKVFDEHEIGKMDDYIKDYGQNIILAKKNGPVWHIDPLLSVSEIPENTLWAEGSGSEYALGAGFVLKKEKPELRIKAAIEAAIEYSTSCGGQPWIKKL